MEQGIDVLISLIVKNADNTVPETDKEEAKKCIDTQLPGFKAGQYLDISILKTVGAEQKTVESTSQPITLVISVPDALRAQERTFRIIRVHDGVAVVLEDLDSDPDTITIQTDRFSTYVIAYGDPAPTTPQPSAPSGGNAPAGDNNTAGNPAGTPVTANLIIGNTVMAGTPAGNGGAGNTAAADAAGGPPTGDVGAPLLWIVLCLLSAVALCLSAARGLTGRREHDR